MSQKNVVSYKRWEMTNPKSVVFPEISEGYVEIDDTSVGLALSGGGSRSHVLCAGYLRGLKEMNVLKDVKYISSVSGGSWASSVFTFAQIDDEKLLGKTVDVSKLDMDYLKTASSGELSEVIINFKPGKEYFLKRIMTKGSKVWQKIIGKSILAKFGLNDKIMAMNEEHKVEIIQKNNIDQKDVVVPKKERPFLIINTVLGGPGGYTTGWGNGLQITPLYSGIPFYRKTTGLMKYYKITIWKRFKRVFTDYNYLFNLKMREDNNEIKADMEILIGGGVIETFALGKEQNFNKPGESTLKKGEKLFKLEDGIGASSAAFATIVQNYDIFSYLNPLIKYSPITRKKTNFYSKQFTLFDGGLLENTGIIPLLQRDLKKIICFINTASPLTSREEFPEGVFSNEDEVTYDQKVKEKDLKYCADTQLLCLFGVVKRPTATNNYTSNHVFETSQLTKVIQDLRTSKAEGRGAVSKHVLNVVDNHYWNVVGDRQVEVIFVYNEKFTKFEEKLPLNTQKQINKSKGVFGKYPFYSTVFQNKQPFALDRCEVNLLTSQACYLLKEHEDKIKGSIV